MSLDPTAPLQHDPADLRSRAADLLSRPPYVEEEPGLLGRLLTWLGDIVGGILGRALEAIAQGSAVGWLVVALGTVVLVAVAWRLSRGATLDRVRPPATPVPPRRRAAEWEEEAEALAAAGDLRGAIRARYGALVALLAETGILEDRPDRTVRELDAEVMAAAPTVADRVHRATARYEAIRYGDAVPTRSDLEVVGAAVETVRDVGTGRDRRSLVAATAGEGSRP